MVGWIIVGVIAWLLLCLFVSAVCGSRRRYPEPVRKDKP